MHLNRFITACFEQVISLLGKENTQSNAEVLFPLQKLFIIPAHLSRIAPTSTFLVSFLSMLINMSRYSIGRLLACFQQDVSLLGRKVLNTRIVYIEQIFSSSNKLYFLRPAVAYSHNFNIPGFIFVDVDLYV
jgi:hypothetical protein